MLDPQRYLARVGLAAAAMALVVGCRTSSQVVEASPDDPGFQGLRYPAPEPSSPSDRLPPPPTPGEGMVEAAPAPPGVAAPDEGLAEAVQNAAVRDQETERLARGYFVLVEALYRMSSARSATDGETYDPLPLSRLHADLVNELNDLARRAAVLQARYLEIATQQSIDLAGDDEAPGRAGRVRFYFRMTTCVRRDTEDRASDGERHLKSVASGVGDDPPASPAQTVKRHANDLKRLAHTLECSRLVSRSLGH
jgi:hypothetical protein